MPAPLREIWRLPQAGAASGPITTRLSARPRIRRSDPATCVMTDFELDPPAAVDGASSLDAAFEQLCRLGVRTALVRHDSEIAGLLDADDLSRRQRLRRDCGTGPVPCEHRYVADVMTPKAELPVIDWLTVIEATVGDLLEIFDGADVEQLIVIDSLPGLDIQVRGLIRRSQLRQQLGQA